MTDHPPNNTLRSDEDLLKELANRDQPVLIGHLGGFECVSVRLARSLTAAGLAEVVLKSQRALVARDTTPCQYCDHPIVEHRGTWIHSDDDGIPLESGRGCRSASFSRDDDWDDSLERSWKAKPKRSA